MDLKAMAARGVRSLVRRRTTGCLLLLLIVLWHFDAASREAAAAWRPVNKISAYVSSVALSKNIVILNHKEQKPFTARVRNDTINLPLVYSADCVSFFSWSICRSGRAEVMSASGDDVIYSVLQIAINSKDHVTASKITTRARTYGRGEPIILETVTEDVRKIRGRGGWLAVRRVGSEPEAVMDWADIGAELPMLGVLGPSDDRPIITVRDYQRDDRRGSGGDKSPKSSPFTFAFSCLLAMGLIAGSGVFSRHAVYGCRGRDDSSYYLFMLFSFLAIFGGFLLLATIFGFFPDAPLPHLDLF
jgi:hypothetical protein